MILCESASVSVPAPRRTYARCDHHVRQMEHASLLQAFNPNTPAIWVETLNGLAIRKLVSKGYFNLP